MHITTDINVTTAALAAAINPLDSSALLDTWDKGCVELYHRIGEWAEVVDKVERRVSALCAAHNGDWPGVFAYEVTENVGKVIRNAILAGRDAALTGQAVYVIALGYAIHFCAENPEIASRLMPVNAD
ncbi:hypothetical protein [Aeromonas phage 25AhydR2PP]|uniref:Uncharacterized protein n=1 Tax=Aeromonas phage 25AhydR2PP TaxID=2163976 RepID=A0A2S1PFQ5_9CAUD|nr:hypothetical protein HOT20_gp48 [Aeromonas phage 25AhydR2PP]AWH15390.1 hypothetical protein [Aeromonas phage 25AhydR2PP]